MLRTKLLIAGFVFSAMVLAIAGSSQPDRGKGISMHFLPKRVADISGRKWGLTSDSSHEVTQTPDEFLSFFRKQPSESQDNGVWIVMTDPNAYGELERKFFSDVQDLCRREKILLFVARAADLPHGWKRSE